MAIPVIVKHMRVVCVSPVNGLEYGETYVVDKVCQSDMFFGGKVIEVRTPRGNTPIGGQHGYFAWRFQPEAGR